MLINPYIYADAFANDYSMQMIRTTTAANIEALYINNKSNAIDTAMRDTTPNFSFSIWFKVDSAAAGTDRNLFSKYEDYAGRDRCFKIRLSTNNKIQVYANYDTNNYCVQFTTTATYTAEEWVHLAFVYDSSKTSAGDIMQFYINGTLVTAYDALTVNTTQKYFYNQTTESFRGPVAIGCEGSEGLRSGGWGGQVDEFTFWNKSLSSTEVTELYNSGAAYDVSKMTSYSSNCLAWYRFGDYASDNWDGSKWNIINVKGTASTDLISANLVEADRLTDAP
jgi:hypothetical protein